MDITLITTLMVVVIIGLCKAFKIGGMKSKYIPITAIVLGLLGAIFYGGLNWLAIGAGVITALTSMGLYSGFKATIAK